MRDLNVFSEIGLIKRVLLHEPGNEINNLTPKYLEELLFDDIPWLPLAKLEHQAFADAFRSNGVEVVYLVDLVKESLINDEVKEEFIDRFIEDLNMKSHTLRQLIKEYLMSFKETKELILKCISGIRKDELPNAKKRSLSDFVESSPFLTQPMPNLYFTRDPFAVIGNGVSLNRMYSNTRRRETIFGEFIFKYHPDFKGVTKYTDRFDEFSIEGGDICVLNESVLIVGVSERTTTEAIENLAKSLFFKNKTSFKKVLAFYIPRERTFMHLDTIFTQVDYDKFTIHKGCYEVMKVYEISIDSKRKNKLYTRELKGKLEKILKKYIKKDVTLIPCGGDDVITSDREQWSDGSNCVCIAPGVVITYERNEVTNNILESYGIKVIRIPSSELSRGRGGPRCMSMPLYRQNLKENK